MIKTLAAVLAALTLIGGGAVVSGATPVENQARMGGGCCL